MHTAHTGGHLDCPAQVTEEGNSTWQVLNKHLAALSVRTDIESDASYPRVKGFHASRRVGLVWLWAIILGFLKNDERMCTTLKLLMLLGHSALCFCLIILKRTQGFSVRLLHFADGNSVCITSDSSLWKYRLPVYSSLSAFCIN